MSDDFQQRGGSPWGTPPGGGGSCLLYTSDAADE